MITIWNSRSEWLKTQPNSLLFRSLLVGISFFSMDNSFRVITSPQTCGSGGLSCCRLFLVLDGSRVADTHLNTSTANHFRPTSFSRGYRQPFICVFVFLFLYYDSDDLSDESFVRMYYKESFLQDPWESLVATKSS